MIKDFIRSQFFIRTIFICFCVRILMSYVVINIAIADSVELRIPYGVNVQWHQPLEVSSQRFNPIEVKVRDY